MNLIPPTDETARLYKLFEDRQSDGYEREVNEFQISQMAHRVALRVAWHAGREAYLYQADDVTEALLQCLKSIKRLPNVDGVCDPIIARVEKALRLKPGETWT